MTIKPLLFLLSEPVKELGNVFSMVNLHAGGPWNQSSLDKPVASLFLQLLSFRVMDTNTQFQHRWYFTHPA